MNCYVSSGMLNPTYALTSFVIMMSSKIHQCHWSELSHVMFCRIVYHIGPAHLCDI